MSKKEIAEEAARIIEERGWCQGVMGRDKRGKPVHPKDEPSCSVCLMSALVIASKAKDIEDVKQLYEEFCTLAKDVPLSIWNDEEGRTVEEVIALLRSIK